MLCSDFSFTNYNCVYILFINSSMTACKTQYLFHPSRPLIVPSGITLGEGRTKPCPSSAAKLREQIPEGTCQLQGEGLGVGPESRACYKELHRNEKNDMPAENLCKHF